MKDRLEEETIQIPVRSARRGDVEFMIRTRLMVTEIKRDADFRRRDHGAQSGQGEPVREQEMMIRGYGLADVLDSWRVIARSVALP